jgi:hypothetical protein
MELYTMRFGQGYAELIFATELLRAKTVDWEVVLLWTSGGVPIAKTLQDYASPLHAAAFSGIM